MKISHVALALLGVIAALGCTKERSAVRHADTGAPGPDATFNPPDAAPSPPAQPPAAEAGRDCHDFGRDLQAMQGDAGTLRGARPATLLVLYEHYRWSGAYAHGGWYMDTAGNQYTFRFGEERTDPMRQAIERDRKLTPKQFAGIVSLSTKIDARASAAELATVETLLPLAAAAGLPKMQGRLCPDAGEAFIRGFIFHKDGSFVDVPLEHQLCGRHYTGKASPEILTLAGWVHLVRQMPCADPSWSSVFKLQ